jgi:hypothetical protein
MLVTTRIGESCRLESQHADVAIYTDYEGHRGRALDFAPARVEIIDVPRG